MSYLSIKNIKKSFDKVEVLKGINLQIQKGEFVCFLGPSGCGKTTLLRILAGLESADSGNIILNKKDITNLEPAKRNLSMVFQSYALFPNMNIYENIDYGLKQFIKNKSQRKEKIQEVLKLVGLDEIFYKFPDELSGGQQQRVSIARALAIEPDILLLDEPLSALDAKVRENLRKEIKAIQQKLKITTIMVTHDQEEAMTLGDRIALMNGGEIVQFDIPSQIYNNPKDIFAADFIGKINFIKNENGEISLIRPENISYSLQKIDDFTSAKIKNIEFRGAFYRLTLSFLKQEILFDMISKEFMNSNLKLNDEIFINLNKKLK